MRTTCLTRKFYCSVSFARQYITDDLDWAQHISEIASKETKTLDFLCGNLALAPKCKTEVKTHTKTLVRPELKYVAPTWSPYYPN